jgi:hypothetical protein
MINIFKPKNSKEYQGINSVSKGIEYTKTTKDTLIKTYYDKSKFDWDLYVILRMETRDLPVIPTVIDIKYHDDLCISPTESVFSGISNISFKASIELDVKNLVSLKNSLEKSGNISYHLIINELISFIRYLKKEQIQVNNLSIDTLFINKETCNFYIVDTVSLTTGDNLDTGIQMLNTSIQESDLKSSIKNYFREQLGIFGQTTITENTLSDIIKMYA